MSLIVREWQTNALAMKKSAIHNIFKTEIMTLLCRPYMRNEMLAKLMAVLKIHSSLQSRPWLSLNQATRRDIFPPDKTSFHFLARFFFF